ncbi:MAG TPA: twin-arginine translocase subunit TatC [Roseiflexaceae bacterium]|nr:twin-arginine translocase subunit TatC [Roseiflexaceae bacterium]
MSSTEFFLVIGLLVFLIATPLIIALIVRVVVKDELPEDLEPEPELTAQFETLGDFWSGMVPHLRELQSRLIRAAVAVLIGTLLGFYIVNSPNLLGMRLPEFLIDHFVPPEVGVQFIAPAEAFVSYMRIALVIGVAFAMPVVVYQLIAFFVPGLLPHEKRILFTAIPFVTELFLAGLAFGWFFTIPAALDFLFGFGQSARIISQPTFESVIKTISTLLLWNGLIFELPALIYLLARLGVVNTRMLGQARRYAIVVITIFAAIITPTGDPYNLLLLAVPMYLLYELGILLSRLVPERKPASSETPLSPA